MKNDQYQQLANQFIEMWQSQMQSMMTDKDFVQTMLSGLQQFSNFATPSHNEAQSKSSTNASHASADVIQLLGQLDYRLRMVETRLLQLESNGRRQSSPKPATKPRRKSSNPAVRKPAKGS